MGAWARDDIATLLLFFLIVEISQEAEDIHIRLSLVSRVGALMAIQFHQNVCT